MENGAIARQEFGLFKSHILEAKVCRRMKYIALTNTRCPTFSLRVNSFMIYDSSRLHLSHWRGGFCSALALRPRPLGPFFPFTLSPSSILNPPSTHRQLSSHKDFEPRKMAHRATCFKCLLFPHQSTQIVRSLHVRIPLGILWANSVNGLH